MTKEDRIVVKNEVKRLENIKPYSYDAYISFLKDIIKNHPFSYFSLVKGRRFKLLWNDIYEKTKFLDSYFSPNAATRVFYYINKLNDIKHCETCNKIIAKNISAINIPLHFFCCNRCAQLHESTIAKTKATKLKNHGDPNWNNIEKNKATCRERYGVDYSFQAKEVKEKSRKSIQDHYGVDHQMKSKEVVNGMRARYKEAHGVEHSFQNLDVQAKIKAKNQEKLGVDWPMQNKELHKIMHENSTQTKKRNYFNDVIIKYENIEPMFNENDFTATSGSFYSLKWKCKHCGTEFNQEMFKYGFEPRCFTCKPALINRTSSNCELEVFNFMKSINESKYECINGDPLNWKLMNNGRQLDIICKRKDTGTFDLAFEFNGLYWHQLNDSNHGYHLNKTIECEKLGIRLIHIWEDEWKNSFKVKEFIIKTLRDEYEIFNDDIIKLDRSKYCLLSIPHNYKVIDILNPSVMIRYDNKGNTYAIEDCGKLICQKI